MLQDNVGIKLKNLKKMPIPVDVHIARATFTTGWLKGEYTGTITDVSPKIDEAWKKIIPKLKHALQMDECLWHLSKQGCTSRKGDFCPRRRECPVGEFCIGGHVHVSSKGIKVRT